MKIYTYNQNCVMAGRVYRGDQPDDNEDLTLWGEGEEEDLERQAREQLARVREGDARDEFQRKEAQYILEYL